LPEERPVVGWFEGESPVRDRLVGWSDDPGEDAFGLARDDGAGRLPRADECVVVSADEVGVVDRGGVLNLAGEASEQRDVSDERSHGARRRVDMGLDLG
jgi:hypothetical protein